MPNPKVMLPNDLVDQEFWNEKPYSFAHAFIDIYILTANGSMTVPPEFLNKKWGWIDDPDPRNQYQLRDILSLPYLLKHISVKEEEGFYTISRVKKTSSAGIVTKEDMVDGLAGRILVYFNDVFGTRYRNAAAWIRGLEYWAQYYSEDEIFEAIRRARADDFWSDKMSPVILFRKKNPQGQDVDYIGGLINKKVRSGKNIFNDMMNSGGK